MKQYTIYIKSHADYPDYEDSCEADSVEEAAKIFSNRARTDINIADIQEEQRKENHE